MKKMSDKTKKWITVAGCLAVCAVLVGFIGAKFQKEPVIDEPLPIQSSQVSDVTVEPPMAEKEEETVTAEPPTAEKEKETAETETPAAEKEEGKEVAVMPPEIPAQTPNAGNGATGNGNGTEQTIQSNVGKPEYTEEQLHDQTQTPDGKPVVTPPPAVEHDKVEQPEEPPRTDGQPQGGDTQNGQIYVPGFGWIDDIGEGQGTVVDGDGDINKQVGIMD